MGLLGKFRQRRDQESMKKMAGVAAVVKGKPSAIQKRRPHADSAQSPIARHLAGRTGPYEPVAVSVETVKVMEAAIQQELSTTTAPRTVTNIAIALADSRKVLKSHANPRNRSPLEKVTKRLRNFSFRIGKYKSDEDVVRRYQIMGAFNRLESLPGSMVKTVSSWDEAKEALKAVIRFPDDDEEEETEEDAVRRPSTPVSETDIAAKFMKEMDDVYRGDETENLKPYSEMWRKVAAVPTPSKLGDSEQFVGAHTTALEKADGMFRLRLASQTAELEERQKRALKEVEERLRAKELEDEARKRASSLMRPLSQDERQRVRQAIDGRKPPDAVLAQCDSDSVQQSSMWTLQSGQWINDEVIHYFLLMLTKRDEELCQKDPGKKRSHFFKSFFITKILNEGHHTLDGKYEYKNVKRWSKKVPGKDLFKLDKIFFPINQGQMHWLCACAFIAEKRIEVYDSMGSSGTKYLNCIFRYLQDDHMDKMGSPLPDLDKWELVACRDATPQQRNGYDCGVFTCMFIDFLSKDCPLVFSQDHVNQCRERIALSILNGKAIM